MTTRRILKCCIVKVTSSKGNGTLLAQYEAVYNRARKAIQIHAPASLNQTFLTLLISLYILGALALFMRRKVYVYTRRIGALSMGLLTSSFVFQHSGSVSYSPILISQARAVDGLA